MWKDVKDFGNILQMNQEQQCKLESQVCVAVHSVAFTSMALGSNPIHVSMWFRFSVPADSLGSQHNLCRVSFQQLKQ